MPEVHTFTYSPQAGPRSPAIDLDVHLPTSNLSNLTAGGKKLKTVIWYHGGGLLQGSRKNMGPHMQSAAEREGVAIVAVDYRHAPQVRLPDILHDISLSFKYVLYSLPRLLADAAPRAPELDVSRVVVTGSSAGGWLALMAGLGMLEHAGLREEDRQRIVGIEAIYPITDPNPADGFYAKPQQPMMDPTWPEKLFEQFSDPDAPAQSNTPGTPLTEPRFQFYVYAQKKGIVQKLLLTDAQIQEGWLEKTNVLKWVAEQGSAKAKSWPSCYITHGNVDQAVPVAQSRELAAGLTGLGVSVTYEEEAGKNHLWDMYDEEETMSGFWAHVRKALG